MKKWLSVPNVTKIVSDHPVFLSFHNKVIKDEIWTALEAASAKAKKIHYKKFHIYSKECKITELQNLFNKIKETVEKVSITGLLLEWEDNIYELTNQSKICDKFVNIFENQIQETKDQYFETMRNMAICRTIAIKCENVYNQDMFIISSIKEKEERFSRTVFAKKFSRNRCAIAKQYYLSHRLIRNIVVKAHLLLPEIFCDFGRYRSVEFIDFDKFVVSVETNLKKSAHIIASYYSEIVQSFSQRRYVQDVPMSALIRFFKCATILLGLQIITRTTDTIKHLLNVLDDQTTIPLLKPNNEYLMTISLRQTTAKSNLIAYANKQRELFIDNLVTKHWNYNLEICATFEMMKERVLNIPQTTKELIELGQYMLTATSTMMIDLQDKIILSVRMMILLIGMTTLGKHHIELNNTTIHWLRRIKPIIERSSALYEQMKFELEEKLQEEVDILNTCVEKMFPRLIIMNNMDDIKRIKEYIEDIRKMVQQLERMEQKAKSINAEEALFQFPSTVYPRIKELREYISPFYILIYRGYQWQRDRRVWLDGPFEYLDVQHIENKLDQYLLDFTKINKQYKTRIKMQLATNYPYSFAGFIDDPDPLQQPAPLKLCHQLIEDVEWFKQYVPLLSVFRNSAMRQIHWDNMSVIAEYDVTPDAGTTLRKIISLNLDLENDELMMDLEK